MIRSRSFSSVRLFVLAPTVDRRHIPDSEGSKRIFCEKFEEQVENWKGQSRQFPLRATLAQHCDHMARWFVSFWTFTTMKICPIPRQHNKFGKVGSKICQTLKNVRFWPNLVTLRVFIRYRYCLTVGDSNLCTPHLMHQRWTSKLAYTYLEL